MEKKGLEKKAGLLFIALSLFIIIAPILSGYDQIFKIQLNFKYQNDSPTLIIQPINLLQEADNPLNFTFNVKYNHTENISCYFRIDENILAQKLDIISNKTIIWPYSLENSSHEWHINCSDEENKQETALNGSFNVNEGFSASISKEIFVIDSAGKLINSNGEIKIESKKESKVAVKIYKQPSTIVYETNTTPKSIQLNNSFIKEKGAYLANITFLRLAKPVSIEKQFSIAGAEISFDKNEIETAEQVKINFKIDSPIEKITSIILDYGDGNSNISYYSINSNTQNINFYHKYSTVGNYTVKASATILGELFEISKGGINVKNSKESKDPEITMISPENNLQINDNKVTFSFKVNDSSKINNCTFELYNYTGSVGTLDYSLKKENVAKNEQVDISLKDFGAGKFSWNVFCCDNESNCNNDLDYYREFNILVLANSSAPASDPENYSQKRELQEVLANIEAFLKKQDLYNAEEKEVLDDLQISKDVEYYKKRLAQIDQDLGYNLKFVQDEATRIKKEQELTSEIEEIKKKIPLDMKIIEKRDFVKNSITDKIEKITEEYLTAKGTKTEPATIKKLAELNYKIQEQLQVSTSAKNVEISYPGKKQEITLIAKKIVLKNDTFNTLLEAIPAGIVGNTSNINFITKSSMIKEGEIFEISVDDLENEKIVYYINEIIDLKKIEETETIVFKEFSIENLGITGFFVADLAIKDYVYIILLVIGCIIIALMIIYYLKKRRIIQWKKEENVLRVFSYLKEAESSLERKDIENSKEKYNKIKEIYPLIPEGCRKYLNKRLERLRIGIDKKEIFSLLNEFQAAKLEKRNEDAKILYDKISLIYKRLPKKYQQKVHEKLVI